MHYVIESSQDPCMVAIPIISILQRSKQAFRNYQFVCFIRGRTRFLTQDCLMSEDECITFSFITFMYPSLLVAVADPMMQCVTEPEGTDRA